MSLTEYSLSTRDTCGKDEGGPHSVLMTRIMQTRDPYLWHLGQIHTDTPSGRDSRSNDNALNFRAKHFWGHSFSNWHLKWSSYSRRVYSLFCSFNNNCALFQRQAWTTDARVGLNCKICTKVRSQRAYNEPSYMVSECVFLFRFSSMVRA